MCMSLTTFRCYNGNEVISYQIRLDLTFLSLVRLSLSQAASITEQSFLCRLQCCFLSQNVVRAYISIFDLRP